MKGGLLLKRGNKYLFKFYLHARHYISIDTSKTETHPHTWEICLYIVRNGDTDPPFKNIEEFVERYFHRFENQLINEVSPFTILNPTMEHMGNVFYKELSNELQEKMTLTLDSLEISENPTRTYIVNQYETYFHDMRKEIEAQMKRFKEEQGMEDKADNMPASNKKAEITTVTHIKDEPRTDLEQSRVLIPRNEQAKSHRKQIKKRAKFSIFKLLTGLMAILSVGFLIAYRTIL
jgi:6-pyruvoyltetrahydropterin/6-carboxytetrahydropterin synthase